MWIRISQPSGDCTTTCQQPCSTRNPLFISNSFWPTQSPPGLGGRRVVTKPLNGTEAGSGRSASQWRGIRHSPPPATKIPEEPEKLTLVLLLPSLLFATLLFYRRAVLDHMNLRVGIIAVIALLIGCLPMVIYSTANPSFIFEFGSSSGRFPNSEILEERFEQFRTTISGQWSINYIAGQTATSGFSRYRSSSALNGMGRFSVVWWLFWTSLILTGVALARRMFRREALSPDARICCFLGSLSIGVIGCSAFFPESGRIHHLMVMFPFIHCQAAITLVWVWKLVSTRHAGVGRAVSLLLVGCVAITAASTFLNMRWHNAHVSRTGGTGVFASEIARLADWDLRASRLSLRVRILGPFSTCLHAYVRQMPLHVDLATVGPNLAACRD